MKQRQKKCSPAIIKVLTLKCEKQTHQCKWILKKEVCKLEDYIMTLHLLRESAQWPDLTIDPPNTQPPEHADTS